MNRIKFILGSLFGVLSFVPALASAQTFRLAGGNMSGVLSTILGLLGMVVPILIALGIIALLYGVMKFIFNAGDEEKRKEGKNLMIYGIIGVVVMVSVWGLVRFVQTTIGIENGPTQMGPQLPGPQQIRTY